MVDISVDVIGWMITSLKCMNNSYTMLTILIGAALISGTWADVRPAAQAEWFHKGRQELRRARRVVRQQNTNLARNIILFVGDGMGISTVTASRIRAGQLNGEDGEDNLLYFERFPHVGLVKTYSADSQVTGSAAAGSAILTGVKINSGVVGCDSRVKKGNCSAFGPDTKLRTILHAFIDEGLSTGIVTNSRITHATPASAYAQTPHRAWEGDVDLPPGDGDCANIDDIAKQLIFNNPDIKVILGGGRRYFLDNSTVDPVLGVADSHQRRDGLNLIEEWERDKLARGYNYSYVWHKSQLDAVDPNRTDFLLGLFNPSHMEFDLPDSSQAENSTEPTLVEMTQKAIEVLQNDPRGYFLMVEGARIDFGHHANSAITAITETLDLDQAVRTAVAMTNYLDTLIIVTADHSHAFAIQGYAPRGHDILGTADPGLESVPLDGLPYTTLGYTNGPAFGREDLTNVDTGSADFRQSGCIPLSIETHAGEDVAVYAVGPMSHLFHATHEQNYLYHVMEYASCVGSSRQYCRNSKVYRRGPRHRPVVQHIHVQTNSPVVQQNDVQSSSPVVQQIDVQSSSPLEQQIDVQSNSPMVQQIDVQTNSPVVQQINIQNSLPVVQQINIQSNSPVEQQIGVQSNSPLVQQINEQTNSPVEQQIYEQTNSPVEQQINEQTNSPVEQQIYVQTNSPVEQQINEQTNSPVEQQIDVQTNSPVEQQIDVQTNSPVEQQIDVQSTHVPIKLVDIQQQ